MEKRRIEKGDKPGPYVCVDTTRLRRGKCYNLTLTSLLRPSTLGQKGRSRDLPDRQWLHWCNDALTPWAPVRQGNNITEHYNPLLLYSVGSFLILCQTLIVNLIYWFAQSVPTFSGSTTQPSHIPQVLYSAKPRPDLGLHPCGAVYNTTLLWFL